jgi:PfaB family protein
MVEPIAVVGLAGTFPGAPDVDALWEDVVAGAQAAAEPPPGRWVLPVDVAHDPRPARIDHVHSRRACFLADPRPPLEGLPLVPGFPVDELAHLDPLFHLAVAAGARAWHQVERESIDPRRVQVVLANIVLPTTAMCAMAEWVYGRAFERELWGAMARPAPDETRRPVPALDRHVAGLPAALVARAIGAGGGSLGLDAACSSSLFAIQLAIRALRSGRADAVVCGGVSRPDALYTQMGFSQLRALSPTGRCSPFDRAADGLVVGEGAGALVLVRLADARAHGDRIRAVVQAVGWSNDVDGNLLAPSEEGQVRAMASAYAQAGWRPSDVDLIECHATGTPIGDAVEFRSLRRLWSGEPARAERCVIGSVKSNVGHLLTAAGAVGVIKTVQAIERGILPPSAGFREPAPGIDLKASPFAVLRGPMPWPAGRPRRAAVSGFGFGGTNAHLLLEADHGVSPDRVSVSVPAGPAAARVAVVGIAARVGAWADEIELQERWLGGGNDRSPGERESERGLGRFFGHFIDDIELAAGELRVPPTELQRSLPQQVLLLQLARRAVAEAGLRGNDPLRTGVFVGLELDPATTDHHLRWMARGRAPAWGRGLDAWLDAACDALGPGLDADYTIGGLGSITASRIARELGTGGPAFVVGGEETSGIAALEIAVDELAAGRIDAAVVAAADVHADLRSLLAAHAEGEGSDAEPLADGAAVLVLQREVDVDPETQRIFAVIAGIARTSGEPDRPDALLDPFAGALARAGSSADALDWAEVAASRRRVHELRRRLGSTTLVGAATGTTGRAGAASGLLAVAGTALALYQHVLPPIDGRPAEPWLRNREDGPRRAAVLVAAPASGATAAAILEGVESPARAEERAQPLGPPEEALFVVEADDDAALVRGLSRLTAVAADAGPRPVDALARAWYKDRGRALAAARAVTIVARDAEETRRLAEAAAAALSRGEDPTAAAPGRVFHARAPIGDAPIAFVYPGSGAQYPGMSRALLLAFPELLRRQDAENRRLRDQFMPEPSWRAGESALDRDPQAVIFATVAHAAFATDVASALGLEPAAIVGYSLGESAALFATRTWCDRDAMMAQARESELFTRWLAGPLDAAREQFGWPSDVPLAWVVGIVRASADQVRATLVGRPRVYLLIVHEPGACVIGGESDAVRDAVEALGLDLHPLSGITSVHCEVLGPVAAAYRALHRRPTHPPSRVRWYSGAWGRSYLPDPETVADALTAQARQGVDFPAVVRAAWQDGARVFLELGPGSGCTRLVGTILGDRPFVARSLGALGQDGIGPILRAVAALVAERVPIAIDPLFPPRAPRPARPAGAVLRIPVVRARAAAPPPLPSALVGSHPSEAAVGTDPITAAFARLVEPTARAHRAYLDLAERVRELATAEVAHHARLGARLGSGENGVARGAAGPWLDRVGCLGLAVGRLRDVLGPRFAAVDEFPTRVRLPDEPLMLVDRIVSVEGEPLSMGPGRVVTEHDVRAGAWYLDGGRIPTCIAIEAGQADLFLSGWLGIDLQTRGRAVYRLLDAEVTFHAPLPGPGATIRYDIRIERFFRQGDTWLFRFGFVGTVDGRPLLTMRDGCAGFFGAAELEAGRGVVIRPHPPRSDAGAPESTPLVAMSDEAFEADRLDALRAGDLAAAFGPAFAGLPLRHPIGLPEGRMRLVHRVTALEPRGGPCGRGRIRAEADITPDAWFLTCHFVDDPVMPGTLMYECCLHTLRIFLLRMGWVGEADQAVFEPIPGVASRLKCRGQVLPSTRTVAYEVFVRELGYGPEPYAICDALMWADERPIVEISGLCARLSGVDRDQLERTWRAGRRIYDKSSILAFAEGRPSDAYGEPYRIFDGPERHCARLPRPPYQFIDRVVEAIGEPFTMRAGAEVLAELDVRPEDWFFASQRQDHMPYAVLLEAALQTCGWTAAWVGSALTSDVDLKFRNLGGEATVRGRVRAVSDRLMSRVRLDRVSSTGGMIIQGFSFAVQSQVAGPVLEGTTYFGFFSDAALAQQVGLPDAVLRAPAPRVAPFPDRAPFPDPKLRMVDRIERLAMTGGPSGLGLVDGSIDVDPEAWFFGAHFLGDPVWPGSLGLEALVQLLAAWAAERWPFGPDARWIGPAVGHRHAWTYRGQIVPDCRRVDVQANIVAVHEAERRVVADGLLAVDGRAIYRMDGFSLEVES